MVRRLSIVAAVFVFSAGLCAAAFSQVPDCEAAKLQSNLSLHRNGAIGVVVAILELKNVSGQTCRVDDAEPNGWLWKQQKSFPLETCRDCSAHDDTSSTHFAVLRPGGYAHMSVQWKDSPQEGGPDCIPIPAMAVNLFFQTARPSAAADLVFSAPLPQACSPLNFTFLTAGRDPFLSSVDTESLGKLQVTMAKTTYYAEEQIFARVTVPTRQPMTVGKRCPKILLNERDPAGNNVYTERGGENDLQCAIEDAEPGSATLRIQLWGSSISIIGEHSLRFLQYNATANGRTWQLAAQSPLIQYSLADPKTLVRTWGPEIDGVALSIGVDKTTYAVGEPIPLHVAFQNLHANDYMTLDPCKRVELIVQNEKGQRFDQVDGDLSCSFSGPCCGGPTIGPGAVVTSEQNLTDYGLPVGTYTVTGEWNTGARLEAPKEQPFPRRQNTQFFHVHSNVVTIRVIMP